MSDFSSVLVIIPSRLALRADGDYFIEAAIKSILSQANVAKLKIEISVGVDLGSKPPSGEQWSKIHFCVGGSTQAAALNAASSVFNHELIAFLEDDDEW